MSTTIPAQFVNDSGVVELEGSLVCTPALTYQVLYAFAFAFDTPGLENGVPMVTPAAGTILYDAWVSVTTAFDGTTPAGDIGTFDGTVVGLFDTANNPFALDTADADASGAGYTLSANNGSVGGTSNNKSAVPGVFDGATPLLLVVSQDGSQGGGPIGGAAGEGIMYLMLATPTALN